MIIKKCSKCGALIKVFKDSNIMCCGEAMKELVPNTFDAAFEKHVPEYEVVNDKVMVKVNHVMEEEHFIEWIAYSYEDRLEIDYLKPMEDAVAAFKYVSGAVIYAYCNKHELWSKVVE